MKNPSKRFLFLDLETNGLDPEKNVIFEVACVITDSMLVELDVFTAVVWHPDHVVKNVSPSIYAMHGPDKTDHTQTCLLEKVRATTKEVGDVEKALLGFFHKNGVEPGKGILAGASIHFDRGFLKKHMPLLEAFFYHRMFDVSALKTAADLWCPKPIVPEAKKAHRALDDVQESIDLARIFKNFFESP